mmetsp:Transcript_8651/g.16025  ORF Transcript_8651/g.16025 Transcript_8651/m.16025 type:complete len:622 (+) Transcript_8651:235-2100(+)
MPLRKLILFLLFSFVTSVSLSNFDVFEFFPARLVDPLNHGLDLLARSELVQACLAIRNERLDERLPLDRLNQLPHQELLDLPLVLGESLGCDVGIDRNSWFVQLHSREGFAQVVGSRLHEWSVEGSTDCNLLRFQSTLRRGELGQVLQGLVMAAHNATLREQVVGHLTHDRLSGLAEMLNGLLADVLHILVAQSDNREHAVRVSRRSGLSHALSSHLHHLERVSEAHDPSENKGGVLSERKAGGAAALLDSLLAVTALLLELLNGGHGADEQCRLGVHGVIELALWSVQTDVKQVVTQHLLGLVEHFLDFRDAEAVLDHPDGLGSLAREEERDGGVWRGRLLHTCRQCRIRCESGLLLLPLLLLSLPVFLVLRSLQLLRVAWLVRLLPPLYGVEPVVIQSPPVANVLVRFRCLCGALVLLLQFLDLVSDVLVVNSHFNRKLLSRVQVRIVVLARDSGIGTSAEQVFVDLEITLEVGEVGCPVQRRESFLVALVHFTSVVQDVMEHIQLLVRRRKVNRRSSTIVLSPVVRVTLHDCGKLFRVTQTDTRVERERRILRGWRVPPRSCHVTRHLVFFFFSCISTINKRKFVAVFFFFPSLSLSSTPLSKGCWQIEATDFRTRIE